MLDFALPGPLFLTSGLVTILELSVATVALAVLVTGKPLRSWGILLTGAAASAALVNLHTFPLTAWYTIDGIFLTASGWWALDSGLRVDRVALRRAGLFLLGLAAFTKQSFALAPVVGVLMLAAHPQIRHSVALRSRRWWVTTIVDLGWLAAFPLAYVGWVTVAGGFPDMVEQMTSAKTTWFERMFNIWDLPSARPDLVLLAASQALLAMLVVLRPKLSGRQGHAAAAIGAALGAWLALDILVEGRLSLNGDWAVLLLWGLLFAAGVDGIRRRRVPIRPLLVALLAWMTSLSWGNDSPSLLGGSLTLSILWLLTYHLPMDQIRAAWKGRAATGLTLVLAMGLVGVTGRLVTDQRERFHYRDQPQPMLNSSLGEVAETMRGIRTNPTTYEYIRQIRQCTERYPATWVAVLPDNGFIYPALSLRNPFPLDWLFTDELVGDAQDRVLEEAGRLNNQGDFLVLFQTVPASSLQSAPLPPDAAVDAPNWGYTGLESGLRQQLDGQDIACGSFVGVWSPAD
jgi:hypothetical protein